MSYKEQNNFWLKHHVTNVLHIPSHLLSLEIKSTPCLLPLGQHHSIVRVWTSKQPGMIRFKSGQGVEFSHLHILLKTESNGGLWSLMLPSRNPYISWPSFWVRWMVWDGMAWDGVGWVGMGWDEKRKGGVERRGQRSRGDEMRWNEIRCGKIRWGEMTSLETFPVFVLGPSYMKQASREEVII